MFLGKTVLIVPEEHKDNGHHDIHGERSWQVGPLELEGVPFQHIETTEENHHDNQGQEPVGVKQTLELVPLAVNDIAKEGEMKILHHLEQTSGIKKSRLSGLMAHSVIEPLGHIASGIDTHSYQPQQKNRHPGMPVQAGGDIIKDIIDDEHEEQSPREPVATLGGRLQHLLYAWPELGPKHHCRCYHEHHGRDNLNLELLPYHHAQTSTRPVEVGLVGEKTADEKEQRHTEQHQKSHGWRVTGILLESHQTYMVCHDKYHRETTEGIKPFQSLLFLCHSYLFLWGNLNFQNIKMTVITI
jgi:hypothetical protein